MRVEPRQTVNDIHSRLNPTSVAHLVKPRDVDELCKAVRFAAERGLEVSVCGGRHAMGGQQFGGDSLLVDMTAMNRPLAFDPHHGTVQFEAGADWPRVIRAVHQYQSTTGICWGIRQKQTGADSLTLGGAVCANVHGRGLFMRPFVEDVESVHLVVSSGEAIECSRQRNADLFSLVCGGYGLFGVIATVTLRLGPRMKLRRLVDVLDVDEAMRAVRRRAAEGCIYGDFQYAIDPASDDFLRRGVCACYLPVSADMPVSDATADLCEEDWIDLLRLAHTDKPEAFRRYASHYMSTHGRIYWSDTMQLSTYIPTYAQFLERHGIDARAESLVIGELYVPPDDLPDFLARSREILRSSGVEDIYGTIRSILQDRTTFLPWARRDYACIIFNLRTPHNNSGIARTARTFEALHAAAIDLGGSFYLTYHRHFTRAQLETCYPQFPEFLRLKAESDPDKRFSSDWYKSVSQMFA